jgi:hypothetical protein
MSITLEIPPELAQRLAAESARLQLPVEGVALGAIQEVLGGQSHEKQSHEKLENSQEWEKSLWKWIESHKPVSHFVDDSRESIYGDER